MVVVTVRHEIESRHHGEGAPTRINPNPKRERGIPVVFLASDSGYDAWCVG